MAALATASAALARMSAARSGAGPASAAIVCAVISADDLAGIAAGRPPDQPFLTALRGYFRELATAGVPEAELGALVTRVRVIQDSPALRAAANALLYRQRDSLAGALASEYGQPAAGLIAAQIAASLLTVQESYFKRLLDGASPQDAGRLLARDAELAFDLLEHGISHQEGE